MGSEMCIRDSLGIARAMLADEPASHRGRQHSIDGAVNSPRPIGSIPIVVGGNGERRTLRLAALHADACNITVGDPAEIRRKLAALERHCESVGRDPSTITKTRAAGLDGLIFNIPDEIGAEAVVLAGETLRAAFG